MSGIGNCFYNPDGRGPRRAASLLRAFLTGALMSLVWGFVSGLLHLEDIFPNTAVDSMFSRPLSFQIILYGIVSPFLEELMFRLLLYDLVRRIAAERIAAVIVSALFALWHGNIIQMLYAFPAGLLLQHLRSRSKGIKEPVLCHIGANLTAIVVSALMPGLKGA